MSPHGGQFTSQTDILMELILEVDERVVGGNVELNVTKDGADYSSSDFLHLWLAFDLEKGL